MSKPRIIIADIDESYVAPLERKFLDELSDRIGLETITDFQYLKDFFSVPQYIDILIISESLYDQMLSRHNISHIFILVENQNDCKTVNERVSAIFKYSSLKEIYSHIMAICSSSIKMESITPNDTKIIMLYSIPGGVGKTTLAMGMCVCIAQNCKKVLYVNAERMNSFQYRLNDQKALPINIITCLRGNYTYSYDYLKDYIRNEYFDYLPPFQAALSTLDIDYAVYKEFIIKSKEMKNYDYIIVDADQILDADKSEMMANADKVIIVTNQTEYSVKSTNLIGKNINCNDNEKYIYICNNYIENEYNALENSQEINFQVDEYVNHIHDITKLSLEEIGQIFDIQKITFLVL